MDSTYYHMEIDVVRDGDIEEDYGQIRIISGHEILSFVIDKNNLTDVDMLVSALNGLKERLKTDA